MLKNQMVSDRDRKKNDYQWYKENADHIINLAYSQSGVLEQETSMLANYKLYNGELDKEDFISFIDPYDVNIKKDDVIHRDLISTKIKVLAGIHSMRPFEWTLTDTSGKKSERKEEKKYKLALQSVVDYLKKDIQSEVMQKYQGQEMTKELQQQMQQEVEQAIQNELPEDVLAHFEETYKDAAEHLGENLINYWLKQTDAVRKFDEAVLHGAISAHSIMYVGIMNDKIVLHPQNPRHFAYGFGNACGDGAAADRAGYGRGTSD